MAIGWFAETRGAVGAQEQGFSRLEPHEFILRQSLESDRYLVEDPGSCTFAGPSVDVDEH